MAEDNDLERRAVAELLQEASRARVRAQTMGPTGWMKCPLRRPNKRFLLNTLRTATQQHRPRTDKSGSKGQEAEHKVQPIRSRPNESPEHRRDVRSERHRKRSRSPIRGPDAAPRPSKQTVVVQASSPQSKGKQRDKCSIK